jgi:hypothetical protein
MYFDSVVEDTSTGEPYTEERFPVSVTFSGTYVQGWNTVTMEVEYTETAATGALTVVQTVPSNYKFIIDEGQGSTVNEDPPLPGNATPIGQITLSGFPGDMGAVKLINSSTGESVAEAHELSGDGAYTLYGVDDRGYMFDPNESYYIVIYFPTAMYISSEAISVSDTVYYNGVGWHLDQSDQAK